MSKLLLFKTNIDLNILNINLYDKSFLRAIKKKKQSTNTTKARYVQNDLASNLFIKKKKEITIKPGFSLNTRIHRFTSCKTKKIHFRRTVCVFSVKQKQFLADFLKILYCLRNFTVITKKFKPFIVVLRPKKGGLLCLSCGLSGLLPSQHVNRVFKEKCSMFLPLNKSSYDYKIKSGFYTSNLKLIFKIPFNRLFIKIFPGFNKKTILVKRYRERKSFKMVQPIFFIKNNLFSKK